ncbi:hypothetical protein D9M70_565710 [compost metagenome]
MHHRIDTGGSGDLGRQAAGQFGVQNCEVRQQQWRDDDVLLPLTGGHHRHRGHLRAGAGGGRDQDQWQARPLGQVDAIDLPQ